MKEIINDITSDEDYKSLEKKLESKGLLRFSEKRKIKNTSVNILNLLSVIFYINNLSNTYYVKNNRIQCCQESYRSIGDLYRIAKYYSPSVRLKTILHGLLTLLEKHELWTMYCDVVRKRVYYGGISSKYTRHRSSYQRRSLKNSNWEFTEFYNFIRRRSNYLFCEFPEIKLVKKVVN